MPNDFYAERYRAISASLDWTLSVYAGGVNPNGIITEPTGSLLKSSDGRLWRNVGGSNWLEIGDDGAQAWYQTAAGTEGTAMSAVLPLPYPSTDYFAFVTNYSGSYSPVFKVVDKTTTGFTLVSTAPFVAGDRVDFLAVSGGLGPVLDGQAIASLSGTINARFATIGGGPVSTTTTLVADSFTRANSASSLGSTDGPNASDPALWTQHLGTWGIISNQAYVSAVAGGSQNNVATVPVSTSSYYDNTFVQGTFTVLPTQNSTAMNLVIGYVDASNFLYAGVNRSGGGSNIWTVGKVVAGVASTLTIAPGTPAANDIIRLELVDYSHLKFYINGTLTSVVSVGDLRVDGRRAGMHEATTGGTVSGARIDEFSAGITEVTPSAPLSSSFNGASIYNAANQSIGGGGSNEFRVFSSASYDVGGYFTASQPTRLTAPTSAYYDIRSTVRLGYGGGTYRDVGIYRNGTFVTLTRTTPFGAADTFMQTSVTMFLSAGDYVETGVAQNSGGGLNTEVGANYSFTITKLGTQANTAAVAVSGGLFGPTLGTVPTLSTTGFGTSPSTPTWNNQPTSATTNDGTNGLTVYCPGQGSIINQALLRQTAPATPYTIVACISSIAELGVNAVACLGFTDGNSGTAKFQGFFYKPQFGGIDGLAIANTSNLTNPSYSVVAQTSIPIQLNTVFWFKLTDDGTTVTYSISPTGDSDHWLLYASVTKAGSYLGSSGFVNVVFGACGFAGPVRAKLLSWRIT